MKPIVPALTRSVLLTSLAALCAGAGLGAFAGSREAVPADRKRVVAPTDDEHPGDARNPGAAAPASRASHRVPSLPVRTFPNEAEARQTIATLRLEKDPNRQRRAVDELCASLDVRGIVAALGLVEQSPVYSDVERMIVKGLMSRWAELDPRAAADHCADFDARGQNATIYDVMAVWARSDPAAAKQWAVASRNRAAHQYGINAIAGALAESDPDAALEFLSELPVTEDKSFYVSSLFGSLARSDPDRAAELASRLATRALRQRAAGQVMSIWGQTEPGKALAWFLQGESSAEEAVDYQMREPFRGILKNWVATEPEEAVAFASDLPPGASRSAIIGALAESWGAVDPAAAAGWLRELPKSRESHLAFDSLVTSWTKNDPAGAGGFLLAQPAERTRDWLLGTLGRSWAEQDPAAALAWARQHGEPEVERWVAAEALGRMAAKDLDNADRYIAQVKTPEARTNAIFATMNDLTRRDPERAANWVMQMSKTQPVGNAIERPVESWTRRDPEAVGGWLKAQPAGPQRDAAAGAHAGALARKDAPAAAAWAASISDDSLGKSA